MVSDARRVAAAVADPELPVVTIADLGILRDVSADGETATVTITPTYSGCPAMATIRADIAAALRCAGYRSVEIRTVFAPPWTTDWITEEGRAKLSAAGIAPPRGAIEKQSAPPASTAGRRDAPPRALPLLTTAPPSCPRCRAADVVEISRFGATACKSLWRCQTCREPFEHVKEH